MGLKPSEKRALEAQKRIKEAEKRANGLNSNDYENKESIRVSAEEREKILEAKAKRQSKYDGREAPIDDKKERGQDKSYRKLPEEEIEVKGDGYHRESFFGSHVRLITFIITLALVLTVLGPWGIDMLVSKSRDKWNSTNGVQDLKDITVEDIIRLSDSGNITWEKLADYNYEDSSYEKQGKTTYNHKYYVKGNPDLCLEVIGYSDKGKPDIVRIIDYASPEDMDSFADLGENSAEKFLKEHGYIK